MKKILIAITIFIIAFSCVGCSGNPLVGKWEDERDIVEFKSNGKFTSSVYFMSGEYTVNGNQVTMNIPLVGKDTYDFKIENGVLTMRGKIMSSTVQHEFKKK